MIDKREQILTRLLAILVDMISDTAPIVVTAVRNRDLRKDEERPGLVLLDGDEIQSLTFSGKSGRNTGMAPQIMTMSPQIFIVMNEQRPTRETIGPATNALRIQIIQAMSTDDELRALYGSNGSIQLNATTTDMKSGGAVTGSMLLDFRINYPLIPD